MRRRFTATGPVRAVAWAALVVSAWAGACANPPSDTGEATEEGLVLPPAFGPEPRPALEATPPLPSNLTLAGSFAHEPHGRVECSVCHQPVQGHGSHAGVACTDCHPAPPGAAAAQAVGSSECLECHHTQQTARDCAACHPAIAGSPLAVVQTLRPALEGELIERELPFDHAWHDDLACEGCHRSDPLQSFGETCSACHDDHHRADSPCGSCHTPSPLGDHDRAAHLGCSGIGCHSDSADAIPLSRDRCVVCHTAEAEHEPDGDCSPCHLIDDIGAVRTRPAAERGSPPARTPRW